MYSYGPPHRAKQRQDDQLEHTYSSYVRIRDVALKSCQRRWIIGRSGNRGLGISVLAARHDDDDDIIYYITMIFSRRWILRLSSSISEHSKTYFCPLFKVDKTLNWNRFHITQSEKSSPPQKSSKFSQLYH